MVGDGQAAARQRHAVGRQLSNREHIGEVDGLSVANALATEQQGVALALPSAVLQRCHIDGSGRAVFIQLESFSAVGLSHNRFGPFASDSGSRGSSVGFRGRLIRTAGGQRAKG